MDLYREKDTIGGHTFNAGPEFAEYWCMMGHHNAQNFCGYDRFRAGWVNERQIEKVRPAFTADIDTTIHLLPPTAAAPNSSDRELIYLPTHVGEVVHRNQFGVAIPGWAYLIEGRSLKNLDDQDPDARKAGVTPPQKMVDGGLPFSYLPGVIVSKVKPGFEPVEIKVRDANNVDSCCTLEFAAYGEGTVFDDHHGVTITVNSANPDGSFDVRVQRTRRHLPDVKAEGMWLDSPANGYGTYASGIMQTNRPPAHGDPVFIPIVSEVDWHGPIPHVNIHNGTAAHRLNVRARNQGLADATNVKGTVLLFEPQLLTGIDLTNPESFQNLNPISRHDVAFGDIAQGAFADTSLTINPTGPFMAVLLLNPARSPDGLVEFDLTNNVSIDAFVSIFTAPGSPYHPFELKFPVTNLYPIDRHIRITTDDPPPGWSYELGSTQYPDRDYTYLANGSHDEFRLYVQPPDPAQMRPEDLKAMQHTTIEATASMNYRDSWIDMDTLPVDVYLVKKTVLTLGVKVSGPTALLQGTLVYQDGANTRPMAKAPLVITLNGSDGSRKVFFPGDPRYTAKTSRTGFYQQAVQLRKGVQYVATAQFADTLEYKGSVSAPINLGGSKM